MQWAQNYFCEHRTVRKVDENVKPLLKLYKSDDLKDSSSTHLK